MIPKIKDEVKIAKMVVNRIVNEIKEKGEIESCVNEIDIREVFLMEYFDNKLENEWECEFYQMVLDIIFEIIRNYNIVQFKKNDIWFYKFGDLK